MTVPHFDEHVLKLRETYIVATPRQRYSTARKRSRTLKDIGLPGPAEFFGADTWENFRFAVEYRNVLVHECTYIGSDRSVVLIASSHEVLHKLAAAGGLQVIDA